MCLPMSGRMVGWHNPIPFQFSSHWDSRSRRGRQTLSARCPCQPAVIAGHSERMECPVSKILDKSSKSQMTEAAIQEASDLLRGIAGERRADEKIKGVLRRVRDALTKKYGPDHWTASRVRCVWYADRRVSLREGELDQLRALAKRRADTEASNELLELRDRVARLERLLEQTDSAFHSPTIGALRDLVRGQIGSLGEAD